LPDSDIKQQPFRLRRYFSLTSGVAVLVVTLVMSLAYRSTERNEHIELAESRNVVLARIFANSIWPEFSAYLAREAASAQDQQHPQTARLHDALRRMSRGLPVIKIKIYNPHGTAVYSSVQSEIGEDKSTNPAFQEARAGRTVSELTHRGSMSVSEGRIENVDVLSSYIPIDAPGGGIEAVFELYTDVTEVLAEVQRTTLKLVAALIAIFALLYAILLMIVGHADRVLQRQYRALKANEEQIQAKNRELESEIEARRAVEAALRNSEDTAATANRAKTEFLSSMSHELRTPMNAILGFAQLLQSDPARPLHPEQGGFVGQILKAGRHLLDLINEVLDLAKIESGKMTLSIEPVSLADLLGECFPLVQTMAHEKSVRVVAPEALGGVRVLADYMRLKQSLLNLLSNAVKYNRSGGTVTISVAEQPSGRIRISVTDTGHGIAEAMHGDLFRPFHRLGQSATEVEGTGIGLALTRNLVHAMHGEVGFASVLDSGSTFWVELPPATNAAPSPREVMPPASTTQPAPAGHSVLYIEDNPANVALMEVIAKRVPARFLTTHNAELGIALGAAEHPDLIVMDINLPQMNGYEALAQLRQNPATAAIPVMALTANAMPRDIERGLAAGFVRYQTKPFQVDVLVGALRELLGIRP